MMRDEEKSVDGLSKFSVLWISQTPQRRNEKCRCFPKLITLQQLMAIAEILTCQTVFKALIFPVQFLRQ